MLLNLPIGKLEHQNCTKKTFTLLFRNETITRVAAEKKGRTASVVIKGIPKYLTKRDLKSLKETT